jgi:ubiquinone/menaquinone biosynthesis C-methylase UbiE
MGEPNPDRPTLEEQIAAAEVYESLFVPAEFQEWAPRVLAAARIEAGQRVLDVACGTGVLTREVARLVGPKGFVAGVDANPGMLAVAARAAAASGASGASGASAASSPELPRIEWRQAGAEALPYPDDSFDAVVCQFGLMFFNQQAALREMMRVLVPGGHLTAAVWDTLERTPAYATLVALLNRRVGPRAADALRAPFVLGDRNELAALFARADMPDVEIVTHRGSARFPNIRTMVEADVRGWLPAAGIMLSDSQIGEILDEAEHAMRAYVTSVDGAVVFESPAHIVTARKAGA